jgi:hypothetical protein
MFRSSRTLTVSRALPPCEGFVVEGCALTPTRALFASGDRIARS